MSEIVSSTEQAAPGAAPAPRETRTMSLRPEAPAAKPEGAGAAAVTPEGKAPVKPTSTTDGSPDQASDGELKPTGRDFAAIKRERQRAQRERAEADAVIAEAKRYQEAVASKDIHKLMSTFGLTPDQIVDLYTAAYAERPEGDADDAKPKDDPVAKELAELKARVESREQAEQAARLQAGVAKATGDLQATLTKNAEQYRLAASPDAVEVLTSGEYRSGADLAFAVAFERHRATGEYLSHDQALAMVEAYLGDRHRKLSGALGADKSQSAQAAASSAVTDERVRARQPRTTVTNTSASAPARPSGLSRAKDADRRFRERVAALRGGG